MYRRRAFTLLELLLVLALIGVLAAISYPSLDGMIGYHRISAAADAIRGACAQARAHAIEDGRPYRVAFVPGQGNYRVAPDSREFWSGGVSADNSDVPVYSLEDALPKTVRFTDPNQSAGGSNGDSSMPVGSVDPGAWSTLVTFLPDGTIREQNDVSLALHGRAGRGVIVTIRALTGIVTSKRVQVN